MGRIYYNIQYALTWNKNTTQPITIGNNNWQEEQQTTEPMDFISFASWTQLMILFGKYTTNT